MNLKSKVEKLLEFQGIIPIKEKETHKECKDITVNVLKKLGVKETSEFYELYIHYFLGGLNKRDDAYEIIDPCPPQNMERATNFAHEYWAIPKNYILFSTGSSESGYLYNTENEKVYEFSLGQQHLLGTDQLKHWDSFYEFMVWYLTVDEDE